MVIDQRSITHKIFLVSLLLTAFLPQSHANTKDQQYNDSVVAYNSGNYEEAIVIWRNLADDNYHNAQYSLGVAYFNGEGVAQDLKKAIDWFELAAIGGNVQAMFNMGSAYYQGNGTNQDYAKAVEWWQKAAALEQRSAQYNLGLAYYFGKGVEQDLSRAAESLRQAANNGHLGAKNAITLIEKEIDNANNLEFSEKTDLRQIENKNEKAVGSSNEPIEENEIILAEYQAAIVSGSGGQIYASQNLNGTVLANLTVGSPVKIIKIEENWAKINAPGNASVWVYKKYLNKKEDGNAVIQGTSVRARSLPTTGNNSIIVGTFDEGEHLMVLNERDSWSQVVAPARMGFWMPIQNLQILPYVTKHWNQQWKQAISVIFKKSENSTQPERDKENNLLTKKRIRSDDVPIKETFQAAFVKTTRAKVLAARNSDAPLLKMLVEGNLVKIIEIQKPWASIQIPGPVQVWVYGKYVTQNGDKAEISGIDVRARSMPSTTSSSNILGRFLDKTPVRIISKERDWVRVSTVNTITAWILLDELEILDTISEEWTNKWNRVRKEL